MASRRFTATLKGFARHGFAPRQGSKELKQDFFSFSSKAKKDVMSRQDVARAVAAQHELTLAKSERIVSTVFDTILESVSSNKTVKISNFGTFDSIESKARMGRNPSTGEEISIPSKERPRFKAYTAFKDAVNK